MNHGSLVIFYRINKEYKVGDVVTFKKDDKRYVLRIIATQNQTVNANSNGEFFVNGAELKHQIYMESFIPEKSTITYPYSVGENQVFVVGDYRTEMDDSRVFGAIDINAIDGNVIGTLQTKDI